MYRYYRSAQVCYAYLNDVPNASTRESFNPFQQSAWFTRGWTLQELIAPRMVIFYDQYWEEIGTRSSLRNTISYVTGIHRPFATVEDATVAEKMCWASPRSTLRIEDKAYSLLGLFGISMPLLYGEGENAFLRLQLEIMNKINDESIFAWKIHRAADGDARGLLAYTPAAFSLCGDIGPSMLTYRRPPCAMTNRGLRMDALLLDADQSDVKIAVLDCRQGDRTGYLGLYLRELAPKEYCRIRCSEFAMCKVRLVEQLQHKAQQVFVRQYGPLVDRDRWEHRTVIDTTSLYLHDFVVTSCQISEPQKLLTEDELEIEAEAEKRNSLRTISWEADIDEISSLSLRSQKGGPACAILCFRDLDYHGDNFMLLIECVEGQVGANIVLLEGTALEPPSLEPLKVRRLFENQQYRPLYEYRGDRISRLLWSKRCVSLEVLNLKGTDESYHLVRLSINDHGRLIWPDLDTDNYVTRDHELCRVVDKRKQDHLARTRETILMKDKQEETGRLSPPLDAHEDAIEAAQQFFERWRSRSLVPSPSSSPPPPPYMGRDLISLYVGIEIKGPLRQEMKMKEIAESLWRRHDVQGRLRALSDSDVSSITSARSSVLDSPGDTAEDSITQYGSPRLEHWRDGLWTRDANLLRRESDEQHHTTLSPSPVSPRRRSEEYSSTSREEALETRCSANQWEWGSEDEHGTISYSERDRPQPREAQNSRNKSPSGVNSSDQSSEHVTPREPPKHQYWHPGYCNPTWDPAPPYQLIDMFAMNGDIELGGPYTKGDPPIILERKRKRETQVQLPMKMLRKGRSSLTRRSC